MEAVVSGAVLLILIFGRRAFRSAKRRSGRRRAFRPALTRRRSSPPLAPQRERTARVEPRERVLEGRAFVIDGDSLVIGTTQVRLFGIDAPELSHPYGQKAKWALVSLCRGQMVRAQITDRDCYGRAVALCVLPDGRDLSAEMVRLGLSIDWPKFSGGRYRAFETADARRKLWLADARQKGRMHVWTAFEAREAARRAGRAGRR